MATALSSRDRMLAAIGAETPDYVPCCFMLFGALRGQCSDQFEFVDRQLEMGLDAYVQLPMRPTRSIRTESEHTDLYGLPLRFDPRVQVRNWREEPPDERYPLIHREYVTPSGTLHTAVSQTDDWPHGVRVPLFDDFVIPRARKHLITGPGDLPALRHLLTPPPPRTSPTPERVPRRPKHSPPSAGSSPSASGACCSTPPAGSAACRT